MKTIYSYHCNCNEEETYDIIKTTTDEGETETTFLIEVSSKESAKIIVEQINKSAI